MKKFEVLEHKADLKIRVFGKDLKDLFLNAMLGMFKGARYQPETQPPTLSKKVGGKIRKEIRVKSLDLPSLLVDFLSEILYLVETRKEVYQRIKFKKFSQNEIEAELSGQKLKRMAVQIKAVTYHQLEIHQEKDGSWQATILFDI